MPIRNVMHPNCSNLVTLNAICNYIDTVNVSNANLANHQTRFVQSLHSTHIHSSQALSGQRNSKLPRNVF